MDNGEVIPGLDEDWSFAGAKAMDWTAGLVMMFIVSELFLKTPAQAMPILMMIWVTTTFGLAAIRRMFPDEERGLCNFVMTACGFSPPSIPSPAVLQPIWSGAPLRELDMTKPFVECGLDEIFYREEPEEED